MATSGVEADWFQLPKKWKRAENGSIPGNAGSNRLSGQEEKNSLTEFAHQNHHR
jgi:hypothetical protein